MPEISITILIFVHKIVQEADKYQSIFFHIVLTAFCLYRRYIFYFQDGSQY